MTNEEILKKFDELWNGDWEDWDDDAGIIDPYKKGEL
jgi:hypothetical protein